MTTPTGGEAGPAIPSFQPEPVDPFNARLDQLRTSMADTHTAEQIAALLGPTVIEIGRWFYGAGRYDGAQEAGAAAPAAADQAPATAGAQPAAGEQDTPQESLKDAFFRRPLWVSVDVKLGWRERLTAYYQNEASAPLLTAARKRDAQLYGLSDDALVRAAAAGRQQHEVLAFTKVPDEYRQYLPADAAGDPGEDLVAVDYRIGLPHLDGGVIMRALVPVSVAERLDTAPTPRQARSLLNVYVTKSHEDAPAGSPEEEKLGEVAALLDNMGETIDEGREPMLVKISNVAGLAGGQEHNSYVTERVPLSGGEPKRSRFGRR